MVDATLTPPVETAPVVTPAAPAAAVPVAPAAVAPTAPVADAKPAAPKTMLGDPEPVKTEPVAEVKPEVKPDAWKLTAPEGAEIAPERIADVEKFARDQGMTEKQAQTLIARDVAAAKQQAEAQTQAYTKLYDTWADQAKADPVIGGDKLQLAIANAQRFLQAHATAEERQVLAKTPFANNPWLLRILSRAGESLREGTVIGNTTPTTKAEPTAKQALYGNLK